MALRITIDVFSGRPNPVIELTESESKKVLERLQPGRKLARAEAGLPPYFGLGYRGLIIEQSGPRGKALPQTFRLAGGSLFGPELAHRATDEGFEDFFCGSTGPIRKAKLGLEFPAFLRKEMERRRTA